VRGGGVGGGGRGGGAGGVGRGDERGAGAPRAPPIRRIRFHLSGRHASFMTALGHSLSAAGAAGSHRVFHHNSGRMTRRTLLDFFADVTGGAAAKRAPFLVYDDGYRTWTWT